VSSVAVHWEALGPVEPFGAPYRVTGGDGTAPCLKPEFDFVGSLEWDGEM